MKILIEEHKYPFDTVKELFPNIDEIDVVDAKASVNYVGYYYHVPRGECVFILPKVVLAQNDKVFGKYDPQEILDPEKSKKLTKSEKEFIYGLSVWIYRAIAVYHKTHPDSTIVRHERIIKVGKGRRQQASTFLDILLSLIDFNRQNRDWFMFILKNIHSGRNKINWSRTLATSQVIVQDDEPIYIDPVTKKRQINFDEELLRIFYSILAYIKDKYGFPIPININYDIITGPRFERYLNKDGKQGYGMRRLRQIKYKYYSDKALRLWELCFAFFEQSPTVNINAQMKEFLLVKNFNIVFEAVIDELIGDKEFPDRLNKKQEDGKAVDHLFLWDSLTNVDKDKHVYYIGDSKYYKQHNEIGQTSIAKQYTYARNVIQWNLNLFFDEDADDHSKDGPRETDFCLRDEETEGYNIVPNFFISATMPDDLGYSDTIEETQRHAKTHFSQQFPNRLFDRDSLLLTHYDVNFLYVVSLYARDNSMRKKEWRHKVRNIFRDKIRQELTKRYQFYAMRAKPGIVTSEYIRAHFHEIIGKVFAAFPEDKGIIALALDDREKFAVENARLLSSLKQAFTIKECPLGTDPRPLLPPPAYQGIAPLQNAVKRGVLLLNVTNDIARKRLADAPKIAIGLKYSEGSAKIIENLSNVGFVLFHKRRQDSQRVRAITSFTVEQAKDLPASLDRYPKDYELYLVANLGEESLQLAQELDCMAVNAKYDATYSTLEELAPRVEVPSK